MDKQNETPTITGNSPIQDSESQYYETGVTTRKLLQELSDFESAQTLEDIPPEAPLSSMIDIDKIDFSKMKAQDLRHLYDILRSFDCWNIITESLPRLRKRFIDSQLSVVDHQTNSEAHTIGELTRQTLWLLCHTTTLIPSKELEAFYSLINHPNHRIRFHATQYTGDLGFLDSVNRKLTHEIMKMHHHLQPAFSQKKINLNISNHLDTSDNGNDVEVKRRIIAKYIAGEYAPEYQGEPFLNIYERIRTDIITKINQPQTDYDRHTAQQLIDTVWADMGGLSDLFIRTMESASDKESMRAAYSLFANRLSAENARKLLRDHALNHPEFDNKRHQIENAIGFKPTASNISEFYSKSNFKPDYSPNIQLQDTEISLLESYLKNDRVGIDFGFGFGRHLIPLIEKGYTVIGIDITSAYFDFVQHECPNANLVQSSFHHVALANNSADIIYMLGRTSLQNATIDEWEQTLMEAYRVLRKPTTLTPPSQENEKNSLSNLLNNLDVLVPVENINVNPNASKFILDKPQVTPGDHYEKSQSEFVNKHNALGVGYYEPGGIVDSPDGVYYSDRFNPNDTQLQAMARKYGFHARKLKPAQYTDEEGNRNTNEYWELSIVDNPPTGAEKIALSYFIKTSGPPLYFEWV